MNNISMGYFTVNVRFANGAAPVRDSRIVLKKGEDYFGEFSTDSDGKISRLPLETGDNYSISVFAEGFYQREYENIPIYEGITTIQNVNLFPLEEEK